MSGSVEVDSLPDAIPAGAIRPRRERRLAQATDALTGSPKVRGSRGRGRPRGRPPRRGRPPIPRQQNDDASETSDTSRGAYIPDHSNMVHQDELYCICRKPYQADKFMIGCDRCDGWFHPDCVSITTQQAMRMQSYTCPTCASSGILPKKKRKRGMLTMPPLMSGGKSYSSLMSPETLKRRMAVVRDFASRLSDDLISGPFGSSICSDAEVSSDEGESRLIAVASDINDADFIFDNVNDAIPDFDERDRRIIQQMKRRRLECMVLLQVVRLYQGILESSAEFAKQKSLEMRFEQLSNAKIHIVLREDICLAQPYDPSLSSAICFWCKGDIPISTYCQHVEKCVEQLIDVRCTRSLSSGVVGDASLTESNILDDDIEGRGPSIICAYPFALSNTDFTRPVLISHIPEMLRYCDKPRSDCIEHAGWLQMVETRLIQQKYELRRRARRLDIELIDIDHRIYERQKHVAICRDIANPAVSLPPRSNPENVTASTTGVGAAFQERAAAALASSSN